MSYTGENYNGKKYVSKVGPANTEATLDNVMVRIKAGANQNKVQVKAVTGSITLYGVNISMQQTTVGNLSTNGIVVTSATWVDILPANTYAFAGCTQKIIVRSNLYANNQGVYAITANAGNGTGATGFDKFGITLERLA